MSPPTVRGAADPSAPNQTRLPGVVLLLRRWWWVVVGGLVGLAAGGGLATVQEPTYASTAYLSVAAGEGADPTLVARAAQALARLGAAPSVVGPPLEDAGLPDAAAQPRLFVRIQAAPDAPLISVTGSASTPTAARAVAATVSRTLADLRAFSAFRATLVAAPDLPTSPTVPAWATPAGGAGTGVAVALVLAATVVQRRRPDAGAVTAAPASAA